MDLFNNRQILVSARALEASRVVRIDPGSFRRMMAAESDIGEIVMRAYILRRVAFIRHQSGGVVLIGAGHAGDTLRLQNFMSRNAYPYRLVDVEVDPLASGFPRLLPDRSRSATRGRDARSRCLPQSHQPRSSPTRSA